jgi:SAM-dependent methyltransferase
VDDALYRLHAEREETYWWWVAKNRIICSIIDRYWPVGHRAGSPRPTACDIGCGAGGLLFKLSSRFDVLGIDMSPLARDYCKRRGFDVLDGSLPADLPVRQPESFDVIVLSEVIEHVPQDRASVAAVAQLLKPGGLLVCTVPAHMWLWTSHDDFNLHQRRYTRSSFGALFTGLGLTPRVLSYYQTASFPLVVGARLVEKLGKTFGRPDPTEPEIKLLPGPINWTLTKAFEAEKHWLPRARLPWGTSVISAHQRT